MLEQTVLQLPFEDFTGKVGGQGYAKETYNRGNDIMLFKIPFKDILIWEGYNARTVFENISELADSLYTHKQKVPFQLVLVKEGNRAFLKKGGRRYKAYQLLIEQGRFDIETEVPFELTNTKETIEEMILDLHVSNNLQEPLKPIDLATVAWRLKHVCGKEKSNEEVAEQMKVSRQTVDNLIIIAEAPDDVKNQIREGLMNMTNAVSFVRAQRKQSKSADKAEEESHKTQTSINLEPQDALKDDIADLAALEEKAEEFKQREAAKNARDLERLLDLANEVLVNKESLLPHIGKRFAAPAYGIWDEDFADENTGEIVNIERQQLLLSKDQEVNDAAIDLLIANNSKSVYIYKVHTAAPSVFTELPAEKEKGKFDEDRPEIAQVQNAIKLGDRISVRVERLEISEGDKKDLTDWVKWMQKDLFELRELVNSNKKQNKLR